MIHPNLGKVASSLWPMPRAPLAVEVAKMVLSRYIRRLTPMDRRNRTVWLMIRVKMRGAVANPKGRSPEDHEPIEIPLPLETEVRERQWVHIHVVVCSRNVYGSAEEGGVEQGSTLALQRLHLKFGDREIFVHVTPVPDEAQACRRF